MVRYKYKGEQKVFLYLEKDARQIHPGEEFEIKEGTELEMKIRGTNKFVKVEKKEPEKSSKKTKDKKEVENDG